MLFAIAHGLAVLLIPVAIAGLLLGLLRMRTASVYPGMGVHMSLNALALGLALLVSYRGVFAIRRARTRCPTRR